MTSPTDQVPVIRLSVSREISQGHQIIAETYLPNDCPRKDLDAILDKLHTAMGRQEAMILLPKARAEAKLRLDRFEKANQDIDRIDERYRADVELAGAEGKRRTAPHMRPGDKVARENAQITIQRLQDEAKVYEAEVKRLEEHIED